MDKVNTKQFETMKKNIYNLLKEFQRNREWADIGNWLYRLQQTLSDKKFKELPHQVNLAKRLAQCLNISLPAGVHSTTLNVYNTILHNYGQNKIQLLPLMSIGLFPFFEYSSSQLKLELLKIFDEHFTNSHECLQMIVSLMNALLTGLNENNEDLAKKIYAICDKISKKFGRTWVDGAVWVNILKSQKARIPGFKYFMKSFKDRDKIKKIEKIEKVEKIEKIEKGLEEDEEKSINESELELVEKEMLFQLLESKDREDDHKVRFPNFSSLVVNALCTCLDSSQTDSLIKRSALDLMIFYLKIQNRDFISERDGIQLVGMQLQILKNKQYSLTRRVYTYLFGQPNIEGQYQIQPIQKQYELRILNSALSKLFQFGRESEKPLKARNHLFFQNNLQILQTLIGDHPDLSKLILPSLAYDLLNFLKKGKISSKKVMDFSSKIINPNSQIFVTAVLSKILSEQTIKNENNTSDVLVTLQYYFKHRQNSKDEKEESHLEVIQIVIEGILEYLKKTNCKQEKCAAQALELCYQMYKDADNINLTQKSMSLLEQLVKSRPEKSVYGGLLTLHPNPQKQDLLPFINEGSLSIVSLKNLLKLEKGRVEGDERKLIFFAIFKLLNCHLWQEKGIQFINQYRRIYPEEFSELIDKVEPTEWLIYWKRMNGNVEGGVLRMLKNMDDESPLNRQLSKKWVQSSKQIISKIVDPVYKELLQVKESAQILILYKIIQNIFLVQKTQFIIYFFLQKSRYFLPLIDHIFNCMNTDDSQFTTRCISMLQFLLLRAINAEQKIIFIDATLEKTLKLLSKFIQSQNYLLQIELISYLRNFAETFLSFKTLSSNIEELKKLIQFSQMYKIVVIGMKETSVPYVRTLYIDFLHESCEYLTQVIDDKGYIGRIITTVLQKLFFMLRENDISNLQQIIKGQAKDNRRKKSINVTSLELQKVSVTEFNVEAKYGHIIQLWNSIKFYVKISIQNTIHDLPIVQLLSLILQSFPFSYLKYEQISRQVATNEYENLQDEIKNVTGLKKQVLEIFDTLWSNYQDKIIDFLVQNGDPRVLIHGNIDPNAVIKSISKGSTCKSVIKYYKSNKFSLPKGTFHYNSEILIKENQLNYFLYLYTMYCNLGLIRNKKVGSFLESAIQLIKSIRLSSHIQTKLWMLEILYTLSERISFKDLHSEYSKLKSEFQELSKEILQELTMIVTKSKNFTHKYEIKTGIFNIFSKEEKEETSLYDFIQIFPPSIFSLYTKYKETTKNQISESVLDIESFFIQYFLFKQSFNRSEPDFINYLSICTIKTMTAITLPLLMNIYEKDSSKIGLILKDLLMQMLPMCENKSEDNQIYLQTVAQFIHNLLESPSIKQQILKMLRKNIIDIYMGNDFFKCTKNTLTYWKIIIDCCTQNHDLLGELLSKQGLFEGLFTFTRKAQATRLKIKSFERVCFVIYSGRLDKYENKLKTVMQSLNEVMKEEKPSPALLILILFCIRILFVRLSQASLNRLFRYIWPGLITLLIDIFTKENLSKNTNLLLAGLKVIELVHALELQQFNLHKWIFIFDYFGVRLDSPNEKEMPKANLILSPFEFKPILTSVLPQHPFKCTFIPEVLPQQSQELGKRKLIVKEASVDTEEQLRNHAFMLLQYMMDLNQRRVGVIKKEIEDLIEADFISLDDYIFQMK